MNRNCTGRRRGGRHAKGTRSRIETRNKQDPQPHVGDDESTDFSFHLLYDATSYQIFLIGPFLFHNQINGVLLGRNEKKTSICSTSSSAL